MYTLPGAGTKRSRAAQDEIDLRMRALRGNEAEAQRKFELAESERVRERPYRVGSFFPSPLSPLIPPSPPPLGVRARHQHQHKPKPKRKRLHTCGHAHTAPTLFQEAQYDRIVEAMTLLEELVDNSDTKPAEHLLAVAMAPAEIREARTMLAAAQENSRAAKEQERVIEKLRANETRLKLACKDAKKKLRRQQGV